MTNDHPMKISDSTFENEVMQAEQPVLLDFWATWCGPCKMIAPVLEEIAKEHSGKIKVGKLDVDENQSTAMRFGVRSIPTLILFKDGKETERIVGFMQKDKLLARLKPHLA